MKKLINPASLFLYFFTIIVFFFVGIYAAKLIGAGKNQMLAGGAIVFFYGVVSSIIAVIGALFVAHGVNHSTIIRINKILAIFFFLLVGLTSYMFITREKRENPVHENREKTTAPVNEKLSGVGYPPFL